MEYIKIREASEILGVSVPTLHRWIKSHKHILEPERIGNNWKVSLSAVNDIKSGRVAIAFEKKE